MRLRPASPEGDAATVGITWPMKQTTLGIIAVGVTIAIASVGIVRAELANPDNLKISHCSSGKACVEGNSTGVNTWGVYGISPNDGVHGETRSTIGKAGVTGFSRGTSGLATGVFGKSSNGEGVIGSSIARTSGVGVAGFSDEGTGVNAESRGEAALRAHGDKEQTYIFIGTNSHHRSHCVIDPKANLDCTGTITGGPAIESKHRNAFGQRVLAYSPESATETIEDVGTAQMVGGMANVRLDPAFAAMTDRRWYYVFLTPLGDTRGLYVSLKTASGFQVREVEHGRSILNFDYRIVAHPIDAANDRLPPAPVKSDRLPPAPLMSTQAESGDMAP